MKDFIAIFALLGAVAATTARAQVEPEATSPGQIAISGTVTYSARYMQIAEFYSGASGQMANLSGDVAYTTTSEKHPTTITFNAGDTWGLSGIGYGTGPYESLDLSQSLDGRHWSLQLSDDVSYFSGIPLGEPTPTSPNSIAEPILTLNTAMLDNDASAKLSDKFSAASTLSAGASYNQLEFLNANGASANGLAALSTDGLMLDVEMSHRFGRNTIFGEDVFSQYTYPDSAVGVSVDAYSPLAGWSRTWTRRISTSVSAGPLWLTVQTTPAAPSTTGYSLNASVTDTLKLGTATATFTHGISGGGGFLYGGEMNNLSGSFTRQFGRQLGSEFTLDFVAGYLRTDALSSLASVPGTLNFQGNYSSTYGYAEATRQLGRYFSVYAEYSGFYQGSSSSSVGVLNGVMQMFSYGCGLTPPPIHLRH